MHDQPGCFLGLRAIRSVVMIGTLAVVACGTDGGDGGQPVPNAQQTQSDTVQCQPECTDMECGDDGCGGQCGKCPSAAPFCIEAKCLQTRPSPKSLIVDGPVLKGPTIGFGKTPVSSLRRVIEIKPDAPVPNLLFGTGYLMRDDTDSETAYLAFAVRNVGTTTRCFIKLEQAAWRDASGNIIGPKPDLDYTYVEGPAVANLKSVSTNTCLAPGQTGEVLGLRVHSDEDKTAYFSNVASFTFQTASGSTKNAATTSANVTPSTYSVSKKGLFQELQVTFGNSGFSAAVIPKFATAKAVLLHDDGSPLMWTFLWFEDSPMPMEAQPLPAGESIVVGNNTVQYDGISSRLRAAVKFEDLAVPPPPPPPLPPMGLVGAARTAWMQDINQQRIRLQHAAWLATQQP